MSRSVFLKLGKLAMTLTLPDGMFPTIHRPEESVTAVLTAPVSNCVTFTWTFGRVAPDGSMMYPPSCPGRSGNGEMLSPTPPPTPTPAWNDPVAPHALATP